MEKFIVGETSFGGNSTSKQSVLTDISVNYQDINDNYSKYLYFRSHDKCRLNEYIETSTTLSQTSYNSTKYGTSGSLNSKTIFHTNLDTSRYVYMYTDTTGGGILKITMFQFLFYLITELLKLIWIQF